MIKLPYPNKLELTLMAIGMVLIILGTIARLLGW